MLQYKITKKIRFRSHNGLWFILDQVELKRKPSKASVEGKEETTEIENRMEISSHFHHVGSLWLIHLNGYQKSV